MIKLWDIWHFSPFSSVLASLFSFFSCLIDILITGLCLYAGDACLLWMNFNTLFCWILLNVFMHLCLLLFMIQLLLCSWVYSLSFPKFYNQENTSKTLNLVTLLILSWDCVGLFLWPWKQFLAQTYLAPFPGTKLKTHIPWDTYLFYWF